VASVAEELKTIRIHQRWSGKVQGVGFRPISVRVARAHGLSGWVRNAGPDVEFELEGSREQLNAWADEVSALLPPVAEVSRRMSREIAPEGSTEFSIKPSERSSDSVRLSEMTPDIALCAECLNELTNPTQRRFSYPFISCAQCGPRYSITQTLPFDRAQTSMSHFQMCASCDAEYRDPKSRRYHSQTNCCADCGPRLLFSDRDGAVVAQQSDALRLAGGALRSGAIVAVQGVGGFHLVANARDEGTVAKLRQIKSRNRKPFAVMAKTIAVIEKFAELSEQEVRSLKSPAAPIVLAQKKHSTKVFSSHANNESVEGESEIAAGIAPEIATVGVMLPYTGLHHLLLQSAELDVVVVTSGNLADEPLAIDLAEAVRTLSGKADFFLSNDRPILRRVDDSIVRVMANTEVVFRAGRGKAPQVIPFIKANPMSEEHGVFVGLGAHQKNTFAVSNTQQIVLLPHIGDLSSASSRVAYQNGLSELMTSLEQGKSKILSPHDIETMKITTFCDFHPDYFSSIQAPLGSRKIQHHEAHVYSVLAEHDFKGELLGFAWDGSGLGADGSIWGGEVFYGGPSALKRVASIFPFRLVGGERAIREPRRSAFGLLLATFGPECQQYMRGISDKEFSLFAQMHAQALNAPETSSVGRLFDGFYALIRDYANPRTNEDSKINFQQYEGQSAMELEALASHCEVDVSPFSIELSVTDLLRLDWRIWVREAWQDLTQGRSVEFVAARFHESLAESIAALASHFAKPNQSVALSGGCFQNRILLESAVRRLRARGFQPLWNQKVPPNDGGISVGQAFGGQNVPFCSR